MPEDDAEILGDLMLQLRSGHIVPGVLLQMELTALPRDAAEDGLTGDAQTRMVIADDQTLRNTAGHASISTTARHVRRDEKDEEQAR